MFARDFQKARKQMNIRISIGAGLGAFYKAFKR